MQIEMQNQSGLPDGLLAQEFAREKALKKLVQLRKKAEAEVERLLTFLDTVDGYTMTEREGAVDDEPCDDSELEMNLSAANGRHNSYSGADPRGDLEDDSADDEPSLGSIGSSTGDQTRWCAGAGGDLEDSGLGNEDREEDGLSAGEEDTVDDEPSLGWSIDGVIGNSDGKDRELCNGDA